MRWIGEGFSRDPEPDVDAVAFMGGERLIEIDLRVADEPRADPDGDPTGWETR